MTAAEQFAALAAGAQQLRVVSFRMPGDPSPTVNVSWRRPEGRWDFAGGRSLEEAPAAAYRKFCAEVAP